MPPADPMTATRLHDRPLLGESLAASIESGASRAVRPEWVTRLRHLLFFGKDLEAFERATSRVFARFMHGRGLLATRVLRRHQETPDGAIKLLVGLTDGNAVETVVLPSDRGVSVCLSTQVGCPVACTFCASGRNGLTRNLEVHEIAEQIVHARRVRPDVDRLVVMGIGEPMLNPDHVLEALDRIREEAGIGPRRMIVSTVGANRAIPRLLEYGRKVTLALSLHAPDDALRARLIPTMRHARVADLLDQMDEYIRVTGRKAMAEYTLIKDVNDSLDLARRTGELLRGREIYLNVIPFNPVEGAPYQGVSREDAFRFVDVVRRSGAFATVRKTMGGAEYAACGQLRASRAGGAELDGSGVQP